MDATWDTLIRVYAGNDIERLRSDRSLLEGAFGKTLDQLDDDADFSQRRDLVAELKQKIELGRARWSVPVRAEQVGACLRLVWDDIMFGTHAKARRDLRADLMQALFVEIFRGAWTAAQVAHVEFVVQILKSWKSFFLSYTNRTPRNVNENYRAVIESFVEPTVRKSRDWDKDNLIADAVAGLLRRENLAHGFYDKVNIHVSDDLEQKIGPAAGGSFMFVQVVQFETFVAPLADERNWCFEEYQLFQRGNEQVLRTRDAYRDVFRKRFAPLLVEEEPPALVPFDYEPWVSRVFQEQRYEKLPVVPNDFQRVVHGLAREIVSLHSQVIDTVPA